MQKTDGAVAGNLEVVEPHPIGGNRADRRAKDKYKRTQKGFKVTVELMQAHVQCIKNHLTEVVADGVVTAEEMEPAFAELDKRLISYNKVLNWDNFPGEVPPRNLRGEKIEALIKDFDEFMYAIEQQQEEKRIEETGK